MNRNLFSWAFVCALFLLCFIVFFHGIRGELRGIREEIARQDAAARESLIFHERCIRLTNVPHPPPPMDLRMVLELRGLDENGDEFWWDADSGEWTHSLSGARRAALRPKEGQ